MEIPAWLASICIASLLGFIVYVYKDIRAMMLDVAKLTTRVEELKERIGRMDDHIENLRSGKS